MPGWLHGAAIVSLALALVCGVIVAADILLGRRQKMAVMNLVWPVTQLYMGPLGLWAYFAIGRAPHGNTSQGGDEAPPGGGQQQHGRDPKAGNGPDWRSTFKGTTHCGAGCTLGDFVGDWPVFLLGWTVAGMAIWPKMAAEFVCAFVLGVAFQYFAIVPMRKLAPLPGLWAALKADTLSITAYEVGMFVWMIIVRFGLFGRDLPPTEPVYWFMMQIAMLFGFATSFPMNMWLIRKGWKEAM